jgi:hypothetical protein
MGNVVLRQNVSIALCPVNLFLADWRQTAPASRLSYVTHNSYSDNTTEEEKTVIIPSYKKANLSLYMP